MVAIGQHAEAWTIFWQEQKAGLGCLAYAPRYIRWALEDHWLSFAATLPPATRVIDIGCGSGAAAKTLAAVQRHFRVVGIDIADMDPSSELNFELLPRTRMESLPFADASFGAAVSQFGFEYGDTVQAARELARVLAPAARLSLLVHHADSPIVVDSEPHKRAIEALTGQELQSAFLSGEAATLDRQLALLRQQCPQERIVEQAAQGLRRWIGSDVGRRSAVWHAVIDALAPEQVMLEALETSSVSPRELQSWLAPLAERFDIGPPSTLSVGGGRPLAWRIEGRRK